MTIRAMILAAGLGTRLRPLTNTTPKALILLNGRPLIAYSLLLLKKYGIQEVVINLHHLGELIQGEIGDGSEYGMKIHYSWEPEILGTGGGVRKGGAYFDNAPFLVMNSDILIDVDLKDLIRHHSRHKAIATMVLRPHGSDSSFTPVWVGRNNRIVGIGDKPTTPGKAGPASFMYTGIQILEPRFLDYLPIHGEACVVRQGYVPALAAQEKVCGYAYDGYWNDLGTLDRYRQAESDLKSGRVKLSYLLSTSTARRRVP